MIGTIGILDGRGTVGKNFNTPKIANIANGVTTQEEISKMFSKPFKTGVQNEKPIWVYEHSHYHLINKEEFKDLIIVFDLNGMVESHQFMTNESTLST